MLGVMAAVVALTAVVTAHLVRGEFEEAALPEVAASAPYEEAPDVASGPPPMPEPAPPKIPAAPKTVPAFDAAARADLSRLAVSDPRRFVAGLSDERAMVLAELLDDRVYLNSDKVSLGNLPADLNLSTLPHLDRRLALTAEQQARIEQIKERLKPDIEAEVGAMWKEYSFNLWTLRHMLKARTTGVLDGQKLTREECDDLGRQWSALNGETQAMWKEITEAKKPFDEVYYERVRGVLTAEQAQALDEQRAKFPH